MVGATLVTGVVASTQASAAPFIYDVTVKTNFGTKFTDCFTFEGGTLTVAGLGKLKYTAAPSMPKFYYTAVTSLKSAESLGATFAFAGFKKGTATSGELHAVGADEAHDSYKVTGVAVPACGAAASVAPGANYRPAAQ